MTNKVITVQLPPAVAAAFVPLAAYDPAAHNPAFGGLLSESKARPARGGKPAETKSETKMGASGYKPTPPGTLKVLAGIFTRLITKAASTQATGTPALWAAYKSQDMKAFEKALPDMFSKLIGHLKEASLAHAKKMAEQPATAGGAGYDLAYGNAARDALMSLCSGNDIPLFTGDECLVAEAGARWFAMNAGLMQALTAASKAEDSYALQAFHNNDWSGLESWLKSKTKDVVKHVEKVMAFDGADLKSDGSPRKTAAERKPREQSEASKDRAHLARITTINKRREAANANLPDDKKLPLLPVTARKRKTEQKQEADTTPVQETPAETAQVKSRAPRKNKAPTSSTPPADAPPARAARSSSKKNDPALIPTSGVF